MSTPNIEIVRPHIEAYLKKGYEKLEVASLLQKSRKYPSAITSFIDAYEEIGQAIFLTDKISSNEEITDDDWNKYIKPASHITKILNHWITRKDRFEKSSDEEFEQIRASQIGKIFSLNIIRKEVIEEIKTRISIIRKLHNIRKTFDYSHDLNGQITNIAYNMQDLEILCKFLESECFTSYYTVKLELELLERGLSSDTEELVISKILSSESIKELKKLILKNKSHKFINLREKALAFIDSF